MKLLVGRFLLGCISAVLVLADISSENSIESSPVTTPKAPVVDAVTEKLIKSLPDLTPRIQLSETALNPDKNSKLFSNPPDTPSVKGNVEREIVVIHDQSSGGGGGHHDHGHHDDHHDYNDHHDHHHDHDYHHPPPPRPPPHHHHNHHHPPPPPQYHHYPPPYPGYYPTHYPPYSHGMSQPYVAGAAAYPPPYPYYPPTHNYYNSQPMKPSATIIQTTSTTSSNGQNYPKPTDLLNQGTEYLWNLFGKLGAVTAENHEVVLINPKLSSNLPNTPVQMLTPSWYSNKGKIVPNIDCNNKKE